MVAAGRRSNWDFDSLAHGCWMMPKSRSSNWFVMWPTPCVRGLNWLFAEILLASVSV